MTYSGDKTWRMTRDQIIMAALRKIGEYDSGERPGNQEVADAALALNAIIKELSGEGTGLWIRQRMYLLLEAGVQRYRLGPNGDQAFIDTALRKAVTTAELTGNETLIAVDSWVDYAGEPADAPTSGYVAVRLDDGTLGKQTIRNADTSSVETPGAIGGPAAIGATVWAFSAKGPRPRRINYISRVNTNDIEAPVEIIGRTDYDELSDKRMTGPVVRAHHDAQLDDSWLWVWPTGETTEYPYLSLTAEFYIDDVDDAAENLMFPPEWYNALVYMLAAELAMEYGVDQRTRMEVRQIAEAKKYTLLGTADLENANVRFEFDSP